MANTLVAPAVLAGFPGAPFADALVDAAVASVRGEVGWHIAPSVVETVVVESVGGPHLYLPTLHLTAVTAVRDVTDQSAPVVVTGWRSQATPRFRAGVLFRPGGWYGMFEVDITHGHQVCPPELLPVVAHITQGRRVSTESLGPASMSYDFRDTSHQDHMSRYTIPPCP